MLSLPNEILIDNVSSFLFTDDLKSLRKTGKHLNKLIKTNEKYLDTVCYHKPHGEGKKYFENGQLMSYTTFENGKRVGISKTWHENGQLRLEQPYKHGKEDGETKLWNEKGILQVSKFYKDGKENGELNFWDENGERLMTEFYEDGVKTGFISYEYMVRDL